MKKSYKIFLAIVLCAVLVLCVACSIFVPSDDETEDTAPKTEQNGSSNDEQANDPSDVPSDTPSDEPNTEPTPPTVEPDPPITEPEPPVTEPEPPVTEPEPPIVEPEPETPAQRFTVKLFTTINFVYEIDWDEGKKEFEVGETVSITVKPERQEYIFCGWYDLDTDTLLSTEYTYSFVMPDCDVNLYMKWQWFTIKAHNDDDEAGRIAGPYAGNEIGDFEYVFAVDNTVRLFAYPNENYEFAGWYDENDELVSNVAFYQFVMPMRNVYLVAKWRLANVTHTLEVITEQGGEVYSPMKNVTVSFDLNGASGGCPSPITVTQDTTLTYPAIPWGGGVFRGWYVDRECTELFDFSAPLTHDVKLYAGWARYTGLGGVAYSRSTLKIWQYNSEATCYKSYPHEIQTSFYYFGILTEGQCSLYFRNESATDSTRFTLYNITKGETVFSEEITNTEYQSVTFYSNAGDAFYISTCNGENSAGSICNFYMTGATLPKDGGRISGALLEQHDSLEILSSKIVVLIAKAHEGYVFDGWYDGEGNLISDKIIFAFLMPYTDVVYTAKWRYVG